MMAPRDTETRERKSRNKLWRFMLDAAGTDATGGPRPARTCCGAARAGWAGRWMAREA